jgi:hypothetical protein
MRKRYCYKVDKLVIGSDLSSLIYAYLNDSTLIFREIVPPTAFEFLPLDFPLQLFNHEPTTKELKTIGGTTQIGTPKIELWNRLILVMSSAGKLPFGLKSISIRQTGDTTLTVKTKSRNYDYEAGEIIKIKNTYSKHKVYDWINIRSIGETDLEYIKTDDDFASEIYIYPSTRKGAKQNDKDLLTISNLTDRQLEVFDFGETMSRIRIKIILSDLGIKGPRNGRNPTFPRSPEMYKYAPIKLEHNLRQTRKSKTNNSEEEIVQSFLDQRKDLQEDSYLYRFSRRVSQGSLLSK